MLPFALRVLPILQTREMESISLKQYVERICLLSFQGSAIRYSLAVPVLLVDLRVRDVKEFASLPSLDLPVWRCCIAIYIFSLRQGGKILCFCAECDS